MSFPDMDPSTANLIANAWRDDNLASALSATGHALFALTASMVDLAQAYGETGFVMPDTTPELTERYSRLHRLCARLRELGVEDVAGAAVFSSMDFAETDDEGARQLLLKLVKTTMLGYLRAEAVGEADAQRVTRLAEALIGVRAEMGDYSVEEERHDYAFAEGFVDGLRRDSAKAGTRVEPPKRTMSDAELDAMLAELV
jgi:hypothetical protein